MPGVGLLRHKPQLCCEQEITVVQQRQAEFPPTVNNSQKCMKLLQSPSKGVVNPIALNYNTENPSPVSEFTSDMNYSSNTAALSQGHPIDDLPCVPVDIAESRPTQHPIPPDGSGDFGPFVSGFQEEFRPRSSSFTTGILRGNGRPLECGSTLRRFSDRYVETSARAGSADNVYLQQQQHHPAQLRHSHTVPEIPPHALSNDSGYNTPPNRAHGHTSPPWNGRPHWPIHVSPPGAAGSAQPCYTAGQPKPLNQNLTIDTAGHYQPEPCTPQPQIMVGPPIGYPMSMPIQSGYQSSYQRNHDPHSSLTSQGSTPQTPEEGVCGYQRERKNRLVHVYQTSQSELEKLRAETEVLLEELELEERGERAIDIAATENEVKSMTEENQRLALEIQRLIQRAPSGTCSIGRYPLPAPSGQPTPPQRPVPAARQDLSTPILQPPTPAYPTITSASYPTMPGRSSSPRLSSTNNPNTVSNNSPSGGQLSSLQQMRLVQVPVVPSRPLPPVLPVDPGEETDMWSCKSCTLLNHPLITTCEACETARHPAAGNTRRSLSTPAVGSVGGLVKTSSCGHTSGGCFCHAHLG